MIEHTLHLPTRAPRKMEIPYAGDRHRCPFCGHSMRPGQQCTGCGVWFPSDTPRKFPRKSSPTAYTPQHNGLLDTDPADLDEHDELEEYRAELDRLHDPAADE